MTLVALEPYRAAIRRDVCGACPDRHTGGSCGRPADDPCTIFLNLAPLVESVLAVGGSAFLDDYVTALRTHVCPGCRQDADGECDLRSWGGCKLDSLALRVVEVIESTHEELRAAGAA